MISNLFLDLLITLGCAIIFGLICVVLAITWLAVKIIAQIAKEVNNKCSAVKTAPIDTSGVMDCAKNTDEKKPNMTE